MTSKKTSKKTSLRSNGRERNGITFRKPSLTKQSAADECDINKIMDRYIKTGQIPHGRAEQPRYEFVPAIDFREAQEMIRQAKEKFAGLPARIRAEFNNDPSEMLKYVEDPSRTSEEIEAALSDRTDTSASKPEEKPPTVSSDPPAKPSESPPNEKDTVGDSPQVTT